MELFKCTGEEKHSHYKLVLPGKDRVHNANDDDLVFHTHSHSINEKEFNRLHHHSPKEHEDLTAEELENEVEYLDVPF